MRAEFESENLKGKGQSGDLDANAWMILKYVFKNRVGVLYRIYSTQDTIQCPTLVNMVMDIPFLTKQGNFLTN
jgi:hypothetical protein